MKTVYPPQTKFAGGIIKVIKGFSAKLKVLKDCNQIKGFKGSTRGPAGDILAALRSQ